MRSPTGPEMIPTLGGTRPTTGHTCNAACRTRHSPLDVRAAGAAMLLYGAPITRIPELTTTAVSGGDEPHLVLGTQPATLPPAACRVLRRQADQAQPDSAVGRTIRRMPGGRRRPHQRNPQTVLREVVFAKNCLRSSVRV